MLSALLALPSIANAQTTYTNVFTGLGSSALFLELGQAAVARAAAVAPSGYSVCSWSTGDSTNAAGTTPTTAQKIYAYDQAPAIKNTGNFWVVWTQNSACTNAPAGTVKIWSYIQEDSAVGNRCVYRTGSPLQQCILFVPDPSNTSDVTSANGGNKITGHTDIHAALPTAIYTALLSAQFGVAGTDVRPEDSQFQIYRALQSTGTVLASTNAGGAQYYGLGLEATSSTVPAGYGCTGTPIPVTIGVQGTPEVDGGSGSTYISPWGLGNFGNPGTVTAALYALPGGTDPCTGAAAVSVADIIPVAATPVVVAVNATDSNGFGDSGVTNISRGTLAAFFDGDLCRTGDVGSTRSAFTTTLIREPFSGTYTTMEYSILAGRGIQGSQESGIATPTAQPSTWTTCNGAGGTQARVTSTGNMVYAIQNIPDSLGYFFWSVSNAAAFTSAGGVATNGKYLTVDGVDPLLTTYVNGCIPIAGEHTAGCELSNVTFPNIVNGSYPIWSIQRLVATCSTGAGCTPAQYNEANSLATVAEGLISSTLPDFVPAPSLTVFHSHYLPPVASSDQTRLGLSTIAVANGNCGATEAGGDVGGTVYTTQSDADYCSDFGVSNGITNLRNSNGITGNTGSSSNNGNPGLRQ
jgi:hypothetical protein